MGILLALPLLRLLTGCAGTSALDPVGGQVSHEANQPIPPRVLLAEAGDFPIADLPSVAAKSPPSAAMRRNSSILFPRLTKKATSTIRGSRSISNIFEFNRQVDRCVLKPVAQGYDFVMPDSVQVGISNVFYNFRFPPRFLNNLFQGKGQRRRH